MFVRATVNHFFLILPIRVYTNAKQTPWKQMVSTSVRSIGWWKILPDYGIAISRSCFPPKSVECPWILVPVWVGRNKQMEIESLQKGHYFWIFLVVYKLLNRKVTDWMSQLEAEIYSIGYVECCGWSNPFPSVNACIDPYDWLGLLTRHSNFDNLQCSPFVWFANNFKWTNVTVLPGKLVQILVHLWMLGYNRGIFDWLLLTLSNDWYLVKNVVSLGAFK